jgi:hypothetical protein
LRIRRRGGGVIAGVGPDSATWRDISVAETAAQAREFMDAVLWSAVERASATPIWVRRTTASYAS